MAEGNSNTVVIEAVGKADDKAKERLFFHFECEKLKEKKLVRLKLGKEATVWNKKRDNKDNKRNKKDGCTLSFKFNGSEYFIASKKDKLWCVPTDDKKQDDSIIWFMERKNSEVKFKNKSGKYIVRDGEKAYKLGNPEEAVDFTELSVHDSNVDCTVGKPSSVVLIKDGENYLFCPTADLKKPDQERVMLKVGGGPTLLQKCSSSNEEFTLSYTKSGHTFFISPLSTSFRLWFVKKERIDKITSTRKYKKPSHLFRWVKSTQPSKSEVKQEDGASAENNGHVKVEENKRVKNEAIQKTVAQLKHVASGQFVARDDEGYFKIRNPALFTEKRDTDSKGTEIYVKIQMGNSYFNFPDDPTENVQVIGRGKEAQTSWKKGQTNHDHVFTLSCGKGSEEYFISPAESSSRLFCLTKNQLREVKKERGYDEESHWFEWVHVAGQKKLKLRHVASGSFVSYYKKKQKLEVHDPLFFTESDQIESQRHW